MAKSHDTQFYDDVLKGNAYKDMVRAILEQSGYSVYPFGYESTFSSVKSKLTKDTKCSRTVRRMRSSPDFLVHDEQKKDLMLVEVKMRTKVPPEIKPRLIENIKEFWNDSILVLVVPEGNVFYAQRICEIEIREKYYRLEDFEEFQSIFTKVQSDKLLHYKEKALQDLKKSKVLGSED
jgi:hypothetical protein